MKTEYVFVLILSIGCYLRGSRAERCETISLNMCKNLGYNSTQMPNLMGHVSQIDADQGLVKPAKTRWGTLLACFESLLKSEEILLQMVNTREFVSMAPQAQRESRQRIKDTISDENFVNKLKKGIHILGPVNELTTKFQADNVPISEVYLEFTNLPKTYTGDGAEEYLSQAESTFIKSKIKLRIYEPLLQHECSKYIRLFICSVFVPMCSEHVPGPIPACKGLCEKVKDDCMESFAKIGLPWPQELNCSSFPEPPALCMQQPEEVEQPQTHYVNPEDITFTINCPPNTTPSGGKCVPICKSKQHFDPEEVATFELWVSVWSIICLVFTSFGLITFIIQPKRFRWPARPILYLTSCGFVTCTIYLIRWIEGPYTCAGNLAYEKPAESLSCVGIALILLFCDIAYTLWWTVFCFVWFLSAMKEWSTEAIEKISTRLHAIVWIFSAIPMFYVLMSNHISINHLSGFCEVTNKVLVFFQLFFMIISCILAVLTSVALKNVRKTLIIAGRCPLKLERLFYRLLVISIGISVPYLMYLMCQFYNTFTLSLVKLVLRKTSIIFATLWVYSPKTFDMWRDLLCFCKKSSDENSNQTKSVFASFLPKVFRSRENNAKSNTSALLNNKSIIVDDKKTIFDIFFASTSHNVAPVTRV